MGDTILSGIDDFFLRQTRRHFSRLFATYYGTLRKYFVYFTQEISFSFAEHAILGRISAGEFIIDGDILIYI